MGLRHAAAFAVLLVVSPAAAQNAKGPEAARALAEAGREKFEQGEYAQAIAEFEHAEAVFHAPPHLLFIARARVKLGKLLQAREDYRRIVAEPLPRGAPPAFDKAKEDAKKDLAE